MVEETKQEVKTEIKQPSMIESAAAAANSLKAENERMEANIKKLEELKAFETLGGKSAGAPQETQPKEITDKDYARMVLEGKIKFK